MKNLKVLSYKDDIQKYSESQKIYKKYVKEIVEGVKVRKYTEYLHRSIGQLLRTR